MLLKQLANIIKIVSQGGGLQGKGRRGGASLGEGGGGGKTILRRTRFFQIALRGRGRGNFTRGFCFTGWWETEE